MPNPNRNLLEQKSECEEFRSRVKKDLQDKILNFLKEENVTSKPNDTPDTTILHFFTWVFYKHIIPKPRTVLYSDKVVKIITGASFPQELKDCISQQQLQDCIRKFKCAFEKGSDMNGYASRNTLNLYRPDFVLYNWNLHHLHLTLKKASSRSNRSKIWLICIISPDKVEFVDIVPHGKNEEDFFNKQYLEIINNNNWMSEIHFSKLANVVPKDVNLNNITSGQYFELSKLRGNVLVHIINNETFIQNGICGLATDGTPLKSALLLIRLNKLLNKSKKYQYLTSELIFNNYHYSFLIHLVGLDLPFVIN